MVSNLKQAFGPDQLLPSLIAGLVAGILTIIVSISLAALIFAVVAAILITSLLTGTFFFLLGLFKLGGLVRYMPYPVVGGFLAGTGWLLLQGAVGVMADGSLGLSQLSYLFQADVWLRWLPGALFAVLLLLILRRYSHFLVIPTMLLAAISSPSS